MRIVLLGATLGIIATAFAIIVITALSLAGVPSPVPGVIATVTVAVFWGWSIHRAIPLEEEDVD